MSRAFFLVLAAFGAAQAARDGAVVALRNYALDLRRDAIRDPAVARVAARAAGFIEAVADRMGG